MITTLNLTDFDNSVILIGVGATNKYHLNIVQPETKLEMKKYFGECHLTDAYNLLTDMGIPYSLIYVINLDSTHDYISAAQELMRYEFGYIVPIDLYISDIFYDPMKNAEKTYYLKYFMRLMKNNNNSQVIITDKHANLYKDIDVFIKSMTDIKNDFISKTDNSLEYRNILFVANNIENIEYSNVYLTGMIIATRLDTYPKYNNTDRKKAVFDIDCHDWKEDIAYFKNHSDNSLTIENLLNLSTDPKDRMKVEFVHRIIKYIFNNLNYNEFIGKIHNDYRMMLIEDKTIKYFDQYVGSLIEWFQINDIWVEKIPGMQKIVSVNIKMKIQPIGTLERIEVNKKYAE